MAPPEKWIPFRWHSGPHEISARKDRKGFAPEHRQVLERWQSPAALGYLKGSPVNCLLVSWAAGRPEDAEQQRTLGPLVEAAHAAGMSVAGLVTGSADRQAALRAALGAGLDAIISDGEVPESGLPVIPMTAASEVAPASAPVTVTTGSVWPSIEGESDQEADFNASATRAACIDSNIFRGHLARAFNPDTPFWFLFEPPPGEVFAAAHYTRAITDTATAGAHWAGSLDMTLQAGLAAGAPEALATWQTISNGLAFFARRRNWAALGPKAVLGVVSDFSGVNQMIGEETLNLLVRRNLPFRVIPASLVSSASLASLRAVVCPDEEAPGKTVRRQLLDFASQGGLLIATRSWSSAGTPIENGRHPRFNHYGLAKGRLAILKEDSPDPYLMARDAHILLDRTNDLLRFYNIGSTMCRFDAREDDKTDLLQIVSYATRAASQSVVVWLREPYRTALLWRLGDKAPSPVRSFPELGGITVELENVGAYAAVELSRA